MKKKIYHNNAAGIYAYEAGNDYIKIWFKKSKKPYLYNSIKPGIISVEKMKRLAESGKGLTTYINKYIRDNYYR